MTEGVRAVGSQNYLRDMIDRGGVSVEVAITPMKASSTGCICSIYHHLFTPHPLLLRMIGVIPVNEGGGSGSGMELSEEFNVFNNYGLVGRVIVMVIHFLVIFIILVVPVLVLAVVLVIGKYPLYVCLPFTFLIRWQAMFVCSRYCIPHDSHMNTCHYFFCFVVLLGGVGFGSQ